MTLWQEYKINHPDGYQYSWFCDLYREWRNQLDVVMRQNHIAGDKLFIDYAGQTVPVVNQYTGEVRQAQVFIATLGASSYTYAEATLTQSFRTGLVLTYVPLNTSVEYPMRWYPIT